MDRKALQEVITGKGEELREVAVAWLGRGAGVLAKSGYYTGKILGMIEGRIQRSILCAEMVCR